MVYRKVPTLPMMRKLENFVSDNRMSLSKKRKPLVGGMGKTTLAAMVAEHPDVRRYFIDGVVWVYVGDQELNYSRYTQCLRELVGQLDFYQKVPLFAELLNARHGFNLVYEDVQQMGVKCLETEREFNKMAGLNTERCDVPEFMRNEPLPPGLFADPDAEPEGPDFRL